MISSENIKVNVGLSLKELRISHGLTQEELAEKVGLQPNTIAKIEIGKIYLTSKTLAKFCNYFNVSPVIFYTKRINLNIKENLDYIKEINELLPACNTKTLNSMRNITIIMQSAQ